MIVIITDLITDCNNHDPIIQRIVSFLQGGGSAEPHSPIPPHSPGLGGE